MSRENLATYFGLAIVGFSTKNIQNNTHTNQHFDTQSQSKVLLYLLKIDKVISLFLSVYILFFF